MENENYCNHRVYKCKKCEATGCKKNNCPNQLILDSCNPYNSNFEHGSDRCLKCNVEDQSSFKELSK